MRYQKIDEADEENNVNNSEDSSIPPKQSGSALDKLKAAAAAAPPPPFTLKVLNKEQTHQITGGLTSQSTILQLKLEIERIIEVPVAQQRLIYSGKSLKPDDKTLSFFKIENNSTIHLFPLPPMTVAVSSNASGENSWTGGNNAESSGSHILSLHAVFEPAIPYPVYFDPEVATHSREVRLWSVILIFLSGMTLFNNISYNLSSGKFGNGVLDSIVSIAETTASAIGLYVAQLGLNSVRSMDLTTIRKYLRWLQGLAVLCVSMRILWVFDVVVQVQQAVDRAKSRVNGSGTGTGGADPGNGGSTKPPSNPGIFGDDANVDPSTLTDQVVTSFALQATLIALVCIAAWANCVYRARMFRNSVAHYNESNPVPVPATGSTAVANVGGPRSSSTGNNNELATATVTATAAAGSTQTSTPVAIAISGPSAV